MLTAAETRFGAVLCIKAGPLASIQMLERSQRNRMTPALTGGLIDAVRAAGQDSDVKVIVLHGLPEVFCAGAMSQDLLSTDTERTYTLQPFTRCLLECPIPVVAAVQGHALGGGLLLALYADLAVFSEKSCYAANFIAYGFMPFGGSTYIVREKLGIALGNEMLLSGRAYRGRELAERGAGMAVVAHDEVPRRARQLALRVSAAPRTTLEVLKEALAEKVLIGMDTAIEREYPVHIQTLVAPETRQRIARRYPTSRGTKSEDTSQSRNNLLSNDFRATKTDSVSSKGGGQPW